MANKKQETRSLMGAWVCELAYRLRAEVLAVYVKKRGLAATLYQDYGWPAKKLGE